MILTPLPQADGRIKNRPAIVLREMPPFIVGSIGQISPKRHQRLLKTLSDYLIAS